MEAARDELAKAWLQGILDRASLEDMAEVPLAELAREAPALVVDVLREAAGSASGATARARLTELVAVRGRAIHNDLASLQVLLLGALRREAQDREAYAGGAERLAGAFGSLHAALGEGAGAPTSSAAAAPPRAPAAPAAGAPGPAPAEPEIVAHRGPGGLGGVAELHDSLGRLLAGYRRYSHPFAVLSIDVEGLRRINDAHGREAGDRVLEAVGAAVKREIRTVDHAFRYTEDDFCVLAPYHDARQVVPLAERLRGAVAGALPTGAPPVSLAIGVASCPEHGESAVQLLDAAQQATYAAKAAGSGVAVSNGALQHP
jgi:diguanylate cyclase (GGDEF)-like protein